MVSASLKASDILKKDHNISCRVVDMYSIKPIDSELIYKCAKETGIIGSVEEHNIVGGLGSAISEVTSEICPTFVRKIRHYEICLVNLQETMKSITFG